MAVAEASAVPLRRIAAAGLSLLLQMRASRHRHQMAATAGTEATLTWARRATLGRGICCVRHCSTAVVSWLHRDTAPLTPTLPPA